MLRVVDVHLADDCIDLLLFHLQQFIKLFPQISLLIVLIFIIEICNILFKSQSWRLDIGKVALILQISKDYSFLFLVVGVLLCCFEGGVLEVHVVDGVLEVSEPAVLFVLVL